MPRIKPNRELQGRANASGGWLGKIAVLRIAVFLILLFCAKNCCRLMAQDSHPALLRSSLSAGCGKTIAAKGLQTVSSRDGKGTARKYLMQVPLDYDPHKTYSVVLIFHGKDNTAEGSRSWGLQNAAGAASSAIFVFPQGIPYESDGVGWDVTNQGYDLPFFDTMVHEVESSYCIDQDEVFIAGFSWGGDFAVVLACQRGDTIRAAAVNSATDGFKVENDYRTFQNMPCRSQRYPAMRFEHAAVTDGVYLAPAFATTSRLFQSFDRCSTVPKPVSPSTPDMTCHTYENCAEPYIECPFNAKIGHGLPPNWAQDTWAFFASFRKRDRDSSHYR